MALESLSPNSTPRRSRNGLKSQTKDKKNPYSDRGLDKFSALLTDLEEKRKKIYSQTDPENIVMVRFAYKNSDECVPVVVKQKDKKEDKPPHVADHSEAAMIKRDKKQSRSSLVRVRNLRRLKKPSYFIIGMVILILFLLSVFGRSVTILFTCVLWYLVPVLKQSSSSNSNSNSKSRSASMIKRKEYARILTPSRKMEQHPDRSSALSSPIRAHPRSF